MKRAALIACIAGALTAAGTLRAADGPSALAEARALWRASAPAEYVYAYQKYCDCYRDEPPETFVTVAAGEVQRVYHLHHDSPREVPAREGSLDLYWTIDGLFEKLAGAYASGATVTAEYDPTYGYPVRLFIDYDAGFTGDETDLRLTRFEIR